MAWLCDNVYRQDDGQNLKDFPSVGQQPVPTRFVHIVNPFRSPSGPSSDRVQQLTYESMRRARKFADNIVVDQAAVVALSEQEIVPRDFALAGTIERTVLDKYQFKTECHLPLVFDVLEAGIAYTKKVASECHEEAESIYVVFTNVDICLMPHFYSGLVSMISRGFDCLSVFRRTIVAFEPDLALLPDMYAEYGRDHPGFDCFVFPLSMSEKFIRNDACIGQGTVMRGLLYNLVAAAERMAFIRQAHLTFHLGDDQVWNNEKFGDYQQHNLQQSVAVLQSLLEQNPALQERFRDFCQNNGEPVRLQHK